MKIKARVTPKAKVNKISKEGDFFKIKVTAPPEKGRANEAVIKLLAEYFKVSKSEVIIRSGEKSRIKEIEIIKKITISCQNSDFALKYKH